MRRKIKRRVLGIVNDCRELYSTYQAPKANGVREKIGDIPIANSGLVSCDPPGKGVQGMMERRLYRKRRLAGGFGEGREGYTVRRKERNEQRGLKKGGI